MTGLTDGRTQAEPADHGEPVKLQETEHVFSNNREEEHVKKLSYVIRQFKQMLTNIPL